MSCCACRQQAPICARYRAGRSRTRTREGRPSLPRSWPRAKGGLERPKTARKPRINGETPAHTSVGGAEGVCSTRRPRFVAWAAPGTQASRGEEHACRALLRPRTSVRQPSGCFVRLAKRMGGARSLRQRCPSCRLLSWVARDPSKPFVGPWAGVRTRGVHATHGLWAPGWPLVWCGCPHAGAPPHARPSRGRQPAPPLCVARRLALRTGGGTQRRASRPQIAAAASQVSPPAGHICKARALPVLPPARSQPAPRPTAGSKAAAAVQRQS